MTTGRTQPNRCKRHGAGLIAAAVSAAAIWLPNTSQAQELPTGFQIEERPIQKVPTTFKFQSRISQAKMPAGDQIFSAIFVKLMRGENEELCTEQLNQVKVRDSVLNIEIGRGFNCQLDEVIAANSDLNFKICITDEGNCLKPIALSSVPYAVKASFSQQAQESHTSDIAAQCHYAHRVTADTGMLSVNNQSQFGAGYYDFATPVAPNATAGLTLPTGVSNNGGFLQWTPVNASTQPDFTICRRTHNSTALGKLDVFNVQASAAYFSDAVYIGVSPTVSDPPGTLRVAGRMTSATATIGNATITTASLGATTVTGPLDVRPNNLGFTVDASGNTTFRGQVTITGALTAAHTHNWTDILNTPASFTPSAHALNSATHTGLLSANQVSIRYQEVTSSGLVRANCPAGAKTLGGGCSNSNPVGNVVLVSSYSTPTSWNCEYVSRTTWTSAGSTTARVVCLE